MPRDNYHHQHLSHQETGTFSSSFGKEAGGGCGRMFVWMIGCGGFLLVAVAVCGGIGWYVSQNVKPVAIIPQDSTDKGTTGEVILKISRPIAQGVEAWVEVDGVRKTDWKVGTSQVQLTLPVGKCRVVVKSIFRGQTQTFFDEVVDVSSTAAVVRQVQ